MEQPQIQPQVKSIFDQIDEEAKKANMFIALQKNEKRILKFDVNKISIVDSEYEGKKSRRVEYRVIDVNEPFGGDKTFSLSFRSSKQLNALLKANITTILVERTGIGKDTSYTFIPA